MNRWHLAAAAMSCLLIVACSRHDSVFLLSPVHRAVSGLPALAVEKCVLDRWKRGTRDLHTGRVGDATTLRARSFFRGVPIGLRIRHTDGETRVEYYERRRARPLYWSMIAGCLRHHRVSDEKDGVVGPRS